MAPVSRLFLFLEARFAGTIPQALAGMGFSFRIIHDTPNLSRSMLKRKAKKVSSMGMSSIFAGQFKSWAVRAEALRLLEAQAANQIQNQDDEQDGAENAHAAARTPPGITVISATAAEQQNQNNNQ